MASRENTAIHVALILLVMTTIAGAVTSFMFSNQAKTRLAESNEHLRKAADANNKYQAAYFKVQMLKYLIGDGGVTKADVDAIRASVTDPQVQDVLDMEQQFEKHVKQYGHGLKKERLNYRNFPENILVALKQRNETNVQHQGRVDNLVTEKDAILQRTAKDVQDAADAKKKSDEDLKAERVAFNQSRALMNNDKNKLVQGFNVSRKKMQDENQQLGQQVVAVEKQKKRLESTNQQLVKVRAAMDTETFEVPDGRVTGVDQTNKMAYINLGSIDGLRKGITFAVYPPREVGIIRNRDEIKAEIEVIEILDQRFSRCRIVTQDSIRDPIAPMDQIHTPAWRPGRQIHFALIGLMDIDGDGDSDRAAVKNLIQQNNGIIDAEIDETGAKTGQVSVKTRYVVKGDLIDKVVTSKQYKDFMDEARYFGVQPITMDEFLSYMGWSNKVRTIALGAGSKSDDFREKRNLRTSDQPGNVFRNRKPPQRGKRGSY